MKVTAKAEYACIAILELSRRYDDPQPVQIGKIADEHDIPRSFLVQIFQQLKRVGIVSSVRGSAGGYRLRVPPADLTVWHVVRVFDTTAGLVSRPLRSDRQAARALGAVWRAIAEHEAQVLDGASFAEVSRQVNLDEPPMFHN